MLLMHIFLRRGKFADLYCDHTGTILKGSTTVFLRTMLCIWVGELQLIQCLPRSLFSHFIKLAVNKFTRLLVTHMAWCLRMYLRALERGSPKCHFSKLGLGFSYCVYVKTGSGTSQACLQKRTCWAHDDNRAQNNISHYTTLKSDWQLIKLTHCHHKQILLQSEVQRKGCFISLIYYSKIIFPLSSCLFFASLLGQSKNQGKDTSEGNVDVIKTLFTQDFKCLGDWITSGQI